MRWDQDEYSIVDETAAMDIDAVTALLQATYWAAQRSRETIVTTLRHSLSFGVFHRGKQIGFARVVTDHATVGYLCDVVVDPAHRGCGLGKWLLQTILNHPELRTCRIDLFTKDAQEFYRQFGFGPHKFTNLVRYPPDYAGGGTR